MEGRKRMGWVEEKKKGVREEQVERCEKRRKGMDDGYWRIRLTPPATPGFATVMSSTMPITSAEH